MSLLYEYAQSNGYDINMLFARHNLSMARDGLMYFGDAFLENVKCSSFFDEYAISSILPTQVLEVLLDTAFDYCLLDSDSSLYSDEYHEVITIGDNLFSLISSNEYTNSKLASKVESILDDFGILVSSDLHLFIVNNDGDEDCEVDYFESENTSELIKACFIGDEFTFELYYTETISELGSLLITLRETLIAIKEEFKYEHINSTRDAA